ncbi:serine protease, partial [Vibrio lentus]
TLLALGLSALSSSSFAITNGTTVDWQNNFDDYVSGNCTGLIVGGDKILTAAHCGITDDVIVTHDGSRLTFLSKVDHPDYSEIDNDYDVSILSVDKQPTQNIRFFANLNNPTATVGDAVHAYGFSGSLTELKRGEFVVDRISDISQYRTNHEAALGSTLTEPGDSGSAWFNSSDEVIGVTRGGNVFGDLFYSKDFILETINGWHYPTVRNGMGIQTIKVQSLHVNNALNSANVDGDVTLIGGTCLSMPSIGIDAFQTCTYELDVQGTGLLWLSADEVININPVEEKEESTTLPVSTGGSSGGSLGFLSLFGLAFLGRLRKAQK